MKILVTGGTGHLGRAVVGLLNQEGHDVRVLARRPGDDPGVEWIRGDLATGAGVAAAVAGADTVIHAATNSPAARRGGFRPADFVRSPTDVDIDGTKALLAAAERAGVEHFVHVSIVGLSHMAPLSPYSRVKLAAEDLVRASAAPWSIVRASQFYWLLDGMLARMTRRSPVVLPAHVRMQPVDEDDFARFLVDCATDGGRGERADFSGPEALGMTDLAGRYLAVRNRRRRIWPAPMPRRMQAALTAASTPADGLHGTTTWDEWLRRN